MPEDKERMTAPLRKFLAMEPEEQVIYIIGRRAGIFSRLDDMNDPGLLKHAEKARDAHQITLENVDEFVAEMTKRYI